MSVDEHERAVLTRDVPGKGLVAGDVGTVVSIHEGDDGPAGYTLEFFSVSGETLAVAAVAAVAADAVRPAGRSFGPREVTHARAM